MSGDKKKRASRAQGWEEAKDEFYQESYPTDMDALDKDSKHALEKDPSYIATMLPSKQTRGTIATRKMQKAKDKGTVKNRTANRSHNTTVRRQSNPQDHVAMIPDLTDNIFNEEATWEKIMMIKATPVSLAQKKEMKAKLQRATKLRLQGYEQFKWRRRKFLEQLKQYWEETYTNLELWKASLRKIEGNYGTGVVTYFQFIKWLIFLNIGIFLMMLCFVILPAQTLTAASQVCYNASASDKNTCYENSTIAEESTTLTDILNFIQGTGWMENTQVFFGVYDCSILQFPGEVPHYYNLPFAYILVTISIFIISLFCIVKSAARGFRERLLEADGQYYQFCNLVFGGWDFCIQNDKSANMKHNALYQEIKSHLLEDKQKEEANLRLNESVTKLVMTRMLIHALVFALLAASAALIYFAVSLSRTQLDKSPEEVERFLLEYLPSFTVVALNTLVPILLRYLVMFEKYSSIRLVRMTMLRTVFLRLASLLVLIITLQSVISCNCDNCLQLNCWETYVGQNFYKLVLLDFASHIILTFFINFPRMLIAKHFPSRFTKIIGEQEFDLAKHVLDVVYSQTLCWLGLYFAPLLPAIVAAKLVFIFYIKKFVCLVNSKPSSTVYLASRSKSLFMAILLVAFVVAVVPVGLSIGEITPSANCGPFRGQKVVWDVVLDAFQTLPLDIRHIIFYFGTAGFAVPAFIGLGLALYYFYAVSEANKHMVTVLKNQLVLEGHDKQFLLTRLTVLAKQQQEQGRNKARSLAPNPEVSSVTDNSNAS